MKEENVSKPRKTGELQEHYNKLTTEIKTFIKTVQRTRTKNPTKYIKKLQKICKRSRL